MIVIDDNDVLAGDASTDAVVDYIVSGYVGTTATLLAQSQLSDTPATTIYTSGADGTVITSIVLRNQHSSAVTVNLLIESRGIIPVDMSLGIGSSMVYDGQRVTVLDTSGQILSTWAVDDTPVNGQTAIPVSSNWAFDHNASSAKHMDALMSAQGDMITRDGSVPKRVAGGTEGHIWTMGASEPGWAAGGAGATKELWAPIIQATELYIYENFWPTARCNGTNDAAFVCFKVPHDFNSRTSAEMLLFGAVTEASANIDVHAHYCADGEAFNAHSETDTSSTYGITTNQLDAHDISGILSSLAADDYVGIKIEQKDAGHSFNALGFRLRYS